MSRNVPELDALVPNGTSEELEHLYYSLAWLAGFMGGQLPDERLSEIYRALEGVAPARVTGEAFPWASSGRAAARNYARLGGMHRRSRR